MRKYAIILLILLAITGCGKAEKVATTEATTQAESVEAVTIDEEYLKQSEESDKIVAEMDKAVNDFPDEVSQYIDSYMAMEDLYGVFIVDVKINNDSYMAEVADYVTKAVDGLSKKYDEYDILISYTHKTGWVYTWHSYDNKVGVLINTLTGEAEQNMSVDKLYER